MKKYKKGYTTGVFDLFHIGHLNILKKAKEQCEYLIVGVSTDELVKKYKNKDTVIPFEERKQIVEAIKCVDHVVPQNVLGKIEAHLHLKFDVLFQGSDWKNSPIYVETIKYLKNENVDIVLFPYTQGTSSTKLTRILDEMLLSKKKDS